MKSEIMDIFYAAGRALTVSIQYLVFFQVADTFF